MRREQSSAADVALALKQIHGRRSKYGNRKTTVDGIVFDSAKEAKRYGELKLLQRAGEIQELTRQRKFFLHAPDPYADRQPIVGSYVCDFAYMERKRSRDGELQSLVLIVEDVKGVKTAMYRWKRKHMKAEYGITILET